MLCAKPKAYGRETKPVCARARSCMRVCLCVCGPVVYLYMSVWECMYWHVCDRVRLCTCARTHTCVAARGQVCAHVGVYRRGRMCARMRDVHGYACGLETY